MKKLITILVLLIVCSATAQLESVTGPTDGVLLDTQTTTVLNGLQNPMEGLLVGNTTTKTLWYYNGTEFIDLMAPSSVGSGTGDVVGPASSTDESLALFDNTTGKLLKSSDITLDQFGNLVLGTASGKNITGIGDLKFFGNGNRRIFQDNENASITTSSGNLALMVRDFGVEIEISGADAYIMNGTYDDPLDVATKADVDDAIASSGGNGNGNGGGDSGQGFHVINHTDADDTVISYNNSNVTQGGSATGKSVHNNHRGNHIIDLDNVTILNSIGWIRNRGDSTRVKRTGTDKWILYDSIMDISDGAVIKNNDMLGFARTADEGGNKVFEIYHSEYTIYNETVDPMLDASLAIRLDETSIDPTATTEGDPINIWTDIVSGHNATSTSTNRPSLHLVGGQRTVSFDGTNDFLEIARANVNYVNGDEVTIMIELADIVPDKSVGTQYILSRAGLNPTANHQYSIYSSNNAIRFVPFGNSAILDISDNYAANQVLTLKIKATTFDVFINGTKVITDQALTNSATIDDDLFLGAGYLGGSNYAAFSMQGMYIYESALSDTEIQDRVTYLNSN